VDDGTFNIINQKENQSELSTCFYFDYHYVL